MRCPASHYIIKRRDGSIPAKRPKAQEFRAAARTRQVCYLNAHYFLSAAADQVPTTRVGLSVRTRMRACSSDCAAPACSAGKAQLVVVPFEQGEFYQEQLAREDPMIFAELEKE